MKLKTQHTIAQPARPQPKIKPPSATRPVIESTHSCSRKYCTAIAPLPIPVTTVLITPTATPDAFVVASSA